MCHDVLCTTVAYIFITSFSYHDIIVKYIKDYRDR